jgi:hypothetical protein
MPSSRFSRLTEIILALFFGLVSFVGFMGISASLLIPSGEMQRASPEMAPLFLGPLFAGMGSLAILWIRNRARLAWKSAVAAIALWTIGLHSLGFGGMAVFLPGSYDFMTNLGYSIALCLAPGSLLTLSGLAVLGYEYRRSRQHETPDRVAADMSPGALNRADKVRRAAEYRTSIVNQIKRQRTLGFAPQINPIISKLDQWIARLRQLGDRLSAFEADAIIQRDLKDIPATITRLTTQLAAEADPQIRAQIQATLASYQEHQKHLETLISLMRRTDLEFDKTLASMGAIYSGLQVLDARDIDSDRATRLDADIGEQVNQLGDLLAAMDDTYRSTAGFENKAAS